MKGTLARLVLSLASEEPFKLADLYTLNEEHFELAIDMLNEWRLDRYYMGKAKLFDLSWQVEQMPVHFKMTRTMYLTTKTPNIILTLDMLEQNFNGILHRVF